MKKEETSFVLNGRPATVRPGASVAELLRREELDPGAVVVEVNGRVVERSAHLETVISSDDRVEIVRFMGGG